MVPAHHERRPGPKYCMAHLFYFTVVSPSNATHNTNSSLPLHAYRRMYLVSYSHIGLHRTTSHNEIITFVDTHTGKCRLSRQCSAHKVSSGTQHLRLLNLPATFTAEVSASTGVARKSVVSISVAGWSLSREYLSSLDCCNTLKRAASLRPPSSRVTASLDIPSSMSGLYARRLDSQRVPKCSSLIGTPS
jgi:hypothetical protein